MIINVINDSNIYFLFYFFQRLSSELSEAHSRYRKSDQEKNEIEKQKHLCEIKMKATEDRAKQVLDDSDRRVQLIEHRAKIATNKIHQGIIELTNNLISEINKGRIRLKSARRSVSISTQEGKDISTTTTTTTTPHNPTERTDLEEETIANVSAMLNMSTNEVEEVLGLSSSNSSTTASSPSRYNIASLPSGNTPMRGVRAQHKMAVARLRLALQNDPVDVRTILHVLDSLIIERSKIESALVNVTNQFVLESTNKKIKQAEFELDQLKKSRNGNNNNTIVRMERKEDRSPISNVISSSPTTTINHQNAMSVLAASVPSNVSALVNDIKIQMEREHEAAQFEIFQFRERVQDLELQLAMKDGSVRTKRNRSGDPFIQDISENKSQSITTMVVSELSENANTDDVDKEGVDKEGVDKEQLRPLKRAAIEQRLHELQQDTTSSSRANDANTNNQTGTGTPERAMGIPLQNETTAVMTINAEGGETSARRGTYFGLCKFFF